MTLFDYDISVLGLFNNNVHVVILYFNDSHATPRYLVSILNSFHPPPCTRTLMRLCCFCFYLYFFFFFSYFYFFFYLFQIQSFCNWPRTSPYSPNFSHIIIPSLLKDTSTFIYKYLQTHILNHTSPMDRKARYPFYLRAANGEGGVRDICNKNNKYYN